MDYNLDIFSAMDRFRF